MLERFFPDFKFHSIDALSAEFFLSNDIKFLLLDIDNTLVPYTSPLPDERASAFLKMLDANDIKYAFVSNNKRKRVELFNSGIGAYTYAKAKKPLLFGINAAMKFLGADAAETALVGDQIFTDVYGGIRRGITTILLDPIEERETPFFRFKRRMEKIVLKKYNAELSRLTKE